MQVENTEKMFYIFLQYKYKTKDEQASKFSLTSFLTSSLTRPYDEQVFLGRLYLFVCTRNLAIFVFDNFYEAA